MMIDLIIYFLFLVGLSTILLIVVIIVLLLKDEYKDYLISVGEKND